MVNGVTVLDDVSFLLNGGARPNPGLLGLVLLWVLAVASLAAVAYLIWCYFQERRRLRRMQRRSRTNGGREAALIGQKRCDPARSAADEVSVAGATTRRAA